LSSRNFFNDHLINAAPSLEDLLKTLSFNVNSLTNFHALFFFSTFLPNSFLFGYDDSVTTFFFHCVATGIP
jgi:hypothetical protein